MRISSRTRRLRNISSVCALVCMCVLCVDMTRDTMIDTGGERNIGRGVTNRDYVPFGKRRYLGNK
jgi:hypothetical protein